MTEMGYGSALRRVAQRLLPWRVALERRQFVSALHPSDPFGDLNVRSRRNGVRIVIGRALNINDPRQHFCIGVEESGATIGAEMSPAMFRGHVNLERAPRYFDCALRVHRPADHRRTGVPPTIRAMTQSVGKRLALSLIAECAAMAAASHHRLLSSPAPSVEAHIGRGFGWTQRWSAVSRSRDCVAA